MTATQYRLESSLSGQGAARQSGEDRSVAFNLASTRDAHGTKSSSQGLAHTV